jgi:hypothetical protein
MYKNRLEQTISLSPSEKQLNELKSRVNIQQGWIQRLKQEVTLKILSIYPFLFSNPKRESNVNVFSFSKRPSLIVQIKSN